MKDIIEKLESNVEFTAEDVAEVREFMRRLNKELDKPAPRYGLQRVWDPSTRTLITRKS